MLNAHYPPDSCEPMDLTPLNPIRSDALQLNGIQHGFFTRLGGVSEGLYASLNGGLGSNDQGDHVLENRSRMAKALGAQPEAFLSLYQIHSAETVTVTKPWSTRDRPKADSMVTQLSDVTLAIATADCGPVLFADAEAGVIGAAHAGWKGAFTGVLESTLDAMEKLGAQRQRTIAVLGPTISQTAYEVGQEFKAEFIAVDSAHEAFFVNGKTPGKSHFNLPAFIGYRLKSAGIGHFDDLALCTYDNPTRFFSFRRTTHRQEPDYGRLISAIRLTPL